jgi:arsenite methyltransferase
MSIHLQELRGFISDMYGDVARFPQATFHFATGRTLMERLGYPGDLLDRIPSTALESFAGVGYHFGLDDLRDGERVLDVGSGAGSDAFFAGLRVGPTGHVLGVDMTSAMVEKANRSREAFPLDNVRFEQGYAEALPCDEGTLDCVISNGVINLSPDKPTVFSSIHRALKPGGRLMFSDLVTGVDLPSSIRENCQLWAECIGGAEVEHRYVQLIEQAGFRVERMIHNDYEFIQESTIQAANKFRVHSISALARKGSPVTTT